MLYANITALCVIEAELLPIEVLHCRNMDVRRFFCYRNLDLDPMTFICKLDPCLLEIYRMSENELSTSLLSKVIPWQTDRHDQNNIPQRFAGGQ